jgi:single-stranded-DNA-specific exonuclease
LSIIAKSPVSKGLEALMKTANFDRKKKKFDEEFAAFQVAPRLNAAGRLCSAQLAAELLISNDDNRIKELATYIDNLNTSRKKLQDELVQQVIKRVKETENEPAFVVEGDNWNKGIIGIAAGRIADQFHRPVVLLAKKDAMGNDSVFVGSARSVPGFNLHEALEQCSDLFSAFGGHSAAAGLTIESKNIPEFRERFCSIVGSRIPEEEREGELFIDGEFPIGCFTMKTVKEIAEMSPFGSGNPRPVFAAKNIMLGNIRIMGATGNHFSADVIQGKETLRGVAFNRKHWLDEMKPLDAPMDIAFNLTISDFNGKPELHILDWQRQ